MTSVRVRAPLRVSGQTSHLAAYGVSGDDLATVLVDTMYDAKPRGTQSNRLKSKVVAACAEPGASLAAIAMARGLSANLVHKWRRQAAQAVRMPASRGAAATVLTPRESEFVALPMPATPAEIRVEIRRGATSVAVHWPLPAPGARIALVRPGPQESGACGDSSKY